MKKDRMILFATVVAVCVGLAACGNAPTNATPDIDATNIVLSDTEITVDGKAISGSAQDPVYAANDIVFYLEGQDFTYGEGEAWEEHSQSEADAHTVVHIAQPGTYRISGTLSKGQIAVDLGEDAVENPEAKVTLILDNVDITCSVAPAVIFYHVYECGSGDADSATAQVDTTGAGANVIIADNSTNVIRGSHVARIYKSYELSEDGTEVVDSKKLHKYDGAFYSKQSMNITGGEADTGILSIFGDNEGLNSELHLTINGGWIIIDAGNDGINTNEDNVSVTTINGGKVHIHANGSTGEGDGIDSNGWLVINGGEIIAQSSGISADAGLDSDMGTTVNGGTVIATGTMMDRIETKNQTSVTFRFDKTQEGSEGNGPGYYLQDENETTYLNYMPRNDFSILYFSSPDLTPGDYSFWMDTTQLSGVPMEGGGMMGRSEGFEPGERPEMPEGFKPGERPEMPEGFEPGERPEMPEGFEPGERPEMPEDFKPGERLEMPEGFEPGEKPRFPRKDGGAGIMDTINTDYVSLIFTITEGNNHFFVFQPTTTP